MASKGFNQLTPFIEISRWSDIEFPFKNRPIAGSQRGWHAIEFNKRFQTQAKKGVVNFINLVLTESQRAVGATHHPCHCVMK
ncbi:MAG: hypothetical protein OHK005_11800 [Candidatus Methylacidiphilales bacterium]